MILGGFACLLYALYIGQAIHVERALYADGANFFVELLSKEQWWPIADDFKHIRLLVNVLNQLPVAIALKIGVENLRLLKIFFGAGLFLIPALIYAFCFMLSRRASDYRVFFFSIASLVSCAMPSDIFIINQSFTSLALVWILIHYLLLSFNVRWFDWVVILLVSLLLFRAHESLIIWGGISFMGAAAVIWVRDGRNISNKNLHVYTIGILGLGQLAFVAFWQATHPVGKQTSDFLKLIALLKPGELWIGNTRISILFFCILLVIFVYSLAHRYVLGVSRPAKAILFLIFVSLGGLMVATGAMAIINLDLTNPGREFSYRFLMTFGSAGWMMMSIFAVLIQMNPDHQVRRLCFTALSLGVISASMWQISNNIQWSIFRNAAAQELSLETGPLVDPDRVRDRLASLGKESTYKYRWAWAWTVFGMSLQENGRVVKLFRPEGYEEYFNPPKRIPFILMSGGEIGSEGSGIFSFGEFKLDNNSRP